MKVATWNVNSIRIRLSRLISWLERNQPDVVCLQELKASEPEFPYEPIREVGYRAAVHGQRTYNGVAILARTELKHIRTTFDDGVDESEARFIEARVDGTRVISVYVPNGAVVGSPKWKHKLDWMGHLQGYLYRRLAPSESLVLAGDFNIAPDDRDVSDADKWRDSVLCHEDGRDALKAILRWGLIDVFRRLHPEGGVYSWWDYRQLAFPRNDGLRLDHVFVTRSLADRCREAVVDRQERKGKQPSDHAPVIVTFGR